MSSVTSFMKGKHWIIVLIIIVSSYGIYSGIVSLEHEAINENWQTKDFRFLVDKCVKDVGAASKKYPELTTQYCNCAVRNIQDNFRKSEYLDISNKQSEEQLDVLFPVISNCQKDLQQRIKVKESK